MSNKTSDIGKLTIEQSNESIQRQEAAKKKIEQHKQILYESIGFTMFDSIQIQGKSVGIGIKKDGKQLYIGLVTKMDAVFFNSLPDLQRDDAADYFAAGFNSMPDTSSVNLLVIPQTFDVQAFIKNRNEVMYKKIQHYNPTTRKKVRDMIIEDNVNIERDLSNIVLQDYYMCYFSKTELTDAVMYSREQHDIDERTKAIQKALNEVGSIVGRWDKKAIVGWRFLDKYEMQNLLVYTLTMDMVNVARIDQVGQNSERAAYTKKFYDSNKGIRELMDELEAKIKGFKDDYNLTDDKALKETYRRLIATESQTLDMLNIEYNRRTIHTDEAGRQKRINSRNFSEVR